MIRSGFVIENPTTRSQTKVLEGDAETGGRGWLLEVRCPPNAGPDITEHFHTTWTEHFEIVQGSALYKLDGVQKTAQAGESFVVEPGHRHVHPWNGGTTEMVYRQRDDFGAPTPGAVQDVLGVFATLAKLAREGKVDAEGRPKHPLQLAVTLRTLTAYGGYDAMLPAAVQDLVAATLGRLAEAMGYRSVDPQVVGNPRP